MDIAYTLFSENMRIRSMEAWSRLSIVHKLGLSQILDLEATLGGLSNCATSSCGQP